MATCDPIMVLLEDIEVIDRLVREKFPDVDIYENSFRKKLIAERKAVIHDIVTFFCSEKDCK